MVNCPNCNHANPDDAVTCEACFTALPTLQSCPRCGAPVLSDANFCGQCGHNLQAAPSIAPLPAPSPVAAPPPLPAPPAHPDSDEEITDLTQPIGASLFPVSPEVEPIGSLGDPAEPPTALMGATPEAAPIPGAVTQLQRTIARLVHVHSGAVVMLPEQISLIHLGKPNDRVPPDIDVSGFPHAEVVSRIHADIRVEGDAHYLEDTGSANGTYVNGLFLAPGNRHRLRPGDRIALGKHDLVSFWFQLGS